MTHQHQEGTRGGRGPNWRGQRSGGWARGPGGGRGRGRGRGRDWAEFVEGGWGGGPHFGGPGFRWGRKAGRGDVRAAIIALLAEEPMHGYQIITEITDRSGGAWRPSPGSVYPTLQALEDQGLVTATSNEGRRVFQLTDEGRVAAEGAADGPAPWEEAARHGDRSFRDLGVLVAEVAQAMAQVARTGSPQQVDAVRDILTDTRRRIYLLLAEGPTAGQSASSPASSGEGGAGEPTAGA
ncbi:MAG: PadR family transcriptional regulator [Acidimicrobiales bacterium]|nr:PadR family transcriptional regulator [Acidimicrobiales bacterium]